MALRLIIHVDEAYRLRPRRECRLCSHTFLKKLLLDVDGRVVGVVLRAPWANWHTEEFIDEMAETARNRGAVLGRGLNVDSLVPPAGFEPALPP
jgi:hypothetical protein